MARTTKKPKDMVKVSARAAETLKAIKAAHATDEKHVLRMDIEGDGYSLWLGAEQEEDTAVCGEEIVLLRATPELTELFRRTSMVIDCVDHEDGPRLIVYPEDSPPGEPGTASPKGRRPAAKDSRAPAGKRTGRGAGKAGGSSAGKPAGKRTGGPAAAGARKPAGKAAGRGAGKPAQKATGKTARKPIRK